MECSCFFLMCIAVFLCFQSSMEGQMLVTRSIVATEMLTANKNCIFDFKETPTISEVSTQLFAFYFSRKFFLAGKTLIYFVI